MEEQSLTLQHKSHVLKPPVSQVQCLANIARITTFLIKLCKNSPWHYNTSHVLKPPVSQVQCLTNSRHRLQHRTAINITQYSHSGMPTFLADKWFVFLHYHSTGTRCTLSADAGCWSSLSVDIIRHRNG